jgi:hypothetical protein
MSDAPERIWVFGPDTTGFLSCGYWDRPMDPSVEYVRADTVKRLQAEVAELRERLRWRHVSVRVLPTRWPPIPADPSQHPEPGE